jgi:AhpD family alkylhydroperoxidase
VTGTSPSTAPRIAPGGRRDIGLVGWIVSAVSGRVSGTQPPNLFLTLGRHRPLFRGWLHFAGRMMPGGKLPRRETELVILRVAHLRSCTYEFDHHVHLGRRAGVHGADVERVQLGADAEGWSRREQAMLTAVDALHERQDLTDVEWDGLRQHLDEREAIELLLLVGHYEMLATAITTLRIQPDERRG